MMANVKSWLEERLELSRLAWLGDRKQPEGINWWYTLGSATLIVFIVQILTGSFLMFNYSPSPDHAYDSVQYISNTVVFGSFIRSIHHWGSNAMVLLVVLHALRVYFMAAYRYPRELTWVVGVLLLLLVGGMTLTGFLLPWDQKGYWGTTVATAIPGTTPFIGDWIKTLLRGSGSVGAVTLTRFFTLHVVILPGLIVFLLILHLFLMIRQGISAPPGRTELASE